MSWLRLPGLAAVHKVVRHVGRSYREATTRWCLVVIALWLLAAGLLPVFLPTGGHGGGGLNNLVPSNSRAIEVEKQSLRQFSVPVLSETSVVVHDPHGLSPSLLADVAVQALTQTRAGQANAHPRRRFRIIGAVPIPTDRPDTAVTYLYMSPGTSSTRGVQLAHRYAAHFSGPSVSTYVTGVAPAQVSQGHYLAAHLGTFEAASVVLILLLVALAFRSIVAPFVALLVAAIGFRVDQPILNLLARALGFALPDELKPLILALLLGVVTDYSVLFFASFRVQVGRGLDGREAASQALVQKAGIVGVAGLTVTGGTIALLAGNLQLFRAFGPALALTVVISLLVSLSLTPALLALIGHRLFWPMRASRLQSPSQDLAASGKYRRLVQMVTQPRRAAAVASVTVLLLLAAALPLVWLRLDVTVTAGLPADNEVAQGAAVLAASSVGGVTAPTEMLIEATGTLPRNAALDRLQREVSQQPGVAQVLGPAQNPLPGRYGVVLSRDGRAARLIVIFDSDPLGAEAIADLRHLHDRIAALTSAAGMHDVHVELTGQTAIASELVDLTRSDLRLTLLAAFAIELLILAFYLRVVVAPITLLLCSALGVAATLGLTTLVFQTLKGDPGLLFYEPFATAVLLFALGSDYNVFAVGAIWQEARRHRLSRAMAIAVPRSFRSITVAGFILASTFALVAIIPLETFREVAFTMATGLVIDTLLIRPVLTPAVLTLLDAAGRRPPRRSGSGSGSGSGKEPGSRPRRASEAPT